MTFYCIEYSAEALVDIKSIYGYISQVLQAPITARRQANRIRKEIRELNTFPTRYSLVEWEPWASMKMHKLPVDNYVGFYVVDEKKIVVKIVRIVYAGKI